MDMGMSCSDAARFVAVTMISSRKTSSSTCAVAVPAIAVETATAIAFRWLGNDAELLDSLFIIIPGVDSKKSRDSYIIVTDFNKSLTILKLKSTVIS